jgi:hypothetical protein
MRNFYKLIPILLGLFYVLSSSQSVASTNNNSANNAIEFSSSEDVADFVISNNIETLPYLLNANSANSLFDSINCNPLTEGVKSATLEVTTDLDITSIPLTGKSPESLIQIGYGHETDSPLPMATYSSYTYSQSIYLQSEINVADQRISKLFYKRNTFTELENAGQINIYMGHTSDTSLTDWIDVTTLQKVSYYELIPSPDEDGWVEFYLTVPFIYNNTDNLVIAFDENKSGYDNYGNNFYSNSTTENQSIYYRNSTNCDPTSPESGTLTDSRPNIRLLFEDLPSTPILTVIPESNDFSTIALLTSADKEFSVYNTGIDNLVINDIYLGGSNMDQFSISELPTFPISITNDPAESFNITCTYTPTVGGENDAIIYFNSNQGLDSVLISGYAYCPTITALPWSEYFDNTRTTTVPNITLTWNTIINNYGTIKTEASTALSDPNSVDMYNSNYLSAKLLLITPPLTIDPNSVKVLFSANGEVEDSVIVGVMTHNNDISTFIPVGEFALTRTYRPHKGVGKGIVGK